MCKVVGEGAVVKQQFRNFRVEAARTAEAARKTLKERGCEHYGDMAMRFGQEGGLDDDESDDDVEEVDGDDEAVSVQGAIVGLGGMLLSRAAALLAPAGGDAVRGSLAAAMLQLLQRVVPCATHRARRLCESTLATEFWAPVLRAAAPAAR